LAGIGEDIAELDRLVEDVLATVRLDLGATGDGEVGFQPRAVSVNVEDWVERAAQRFAASHPAHTLRCEPADELPAIVADRELVQRVFDNLLDNAAKYSYPGQAVELCVEAREGKIAVVVRDRGIGVDEQDLPRLFDPFFRTDRSRSRGVGGAGLGLTLCKRIVDAHGGDITAASNPEGGMAIRFTLPLVGPGIGT
jgi:signal transduction histidine kinase